jgi:hypothetical protein
MWPVGRTTAPNGNWQIHFDDVTAGTGYVLCVFDSAGNSDKSDDLTVGS